MPTSKSHWRGQKEKNQRGRLTHKLFSFHEQNPIAMAPKLRQPKTQLELLSYKNVAETTSPEEQPRLMKLLLNVTIQGSLRPV